MHPQKAHLHYFLIGIVHSILILLPLSSVLPPPREMTISHEATPSFTIEANSSSFVKTIRRFHTSHSFLEIPSKFVKEHGEHFRERVSLRGPNRQVKHLLLHVNVHPNKRVFFTGWRGFRLENGIKVGDRLLFTLVSDSTFTVSFQLSAVTLHILKQGNSVEQQIHQQPSSNSFISLSNSSTSSTSQNIVYTHGTRKNVKNEENVENVKNDVIYATGTPRKFKEKIDGVGKKFECPHFVTVMKECNFRNSNAYYLIVPAKFLERYGMYVSEVCSMQGPSGATMEVRFSSPRGKSYFCAGWKAFCKENGICIGDVLLFSLLAPACWLVQVVECT